tara:strand:- start:6194 stop:6979 length:786 start_codon:yes stop_codon:yes gene_type:complete
VELPKLNQSDFLNWKSYYFNYQKTLAEAYYIPLLKQNGINLSSDTKVLDVGCGDGGFLTAFSKLSRDCNGVEIRNFGWEEKSNPKIIIGDITVEEIKNFLKPKYDLLILRDVIEHILLPKKIDFIKSIKNYMDENSRLLITFPPFYSPFGLHQQAILKSPLRIIPFLGWLPKYLIKSILKLFNQMEKWDEIEEIKDSRMTISRFKNLMLECGLEICYHEQYFVRPSHEIRYDVKMRKINWLNIPILKEIFVSGCTFILKKK